MLYMRSQEGALFELAPAGTVTPQPEMAAAGSGEHIVAEAARKAAEFAEATRAAEAAAALAKKQREEEERIALARVEAAKAQQARVEQARVEREKAAEAERRKIEADKAAVAERERKDAERKAEDDARVRREKDRLGQEQEASVRQGMGDDAARQTKAAIVAARLEAVVLSREDAGSTDPPPTVDHLKHKSTFPVWQIGAGVVILGLLIALSWHHLRPHSHSDEEGGASLANSPQGAATRPAPTTPGTPQNGSASGANEPSNGSESGDGSGTSANPASSTGSGAGDAGGSEARGSGEGGKPGDAARTKKSQDTGGGVAGKRAPNAANGAGKSPSATTKPLANNANANPAASGGASTNAASSPLRVSATDQEAKIVKRVSPTYPAQAAQNHISGMVVLDVLIAKDGAVKNVTVTSGDPALTSSAVDAVKQRQYQPTIVDGRAVEVETTVSINYSIKDSPNPAANAEWCRRCRQFRGAAGAVHIGKCRVQRKWHDGHWNGAVRVQRKCEAADARGCGISRGCGQEADHGSFVGGDDAAIGKRHCVFFDGEQAIAERRGRDGRICRGRDDCKEHGRGAVRQAGALPAQLVKEFRDRQRPSNG